MARPQIVIDGGSPGVKASVAAGATVTLTLESTIGVRSVRWTVLSTDETSSTGDYTLSTSGSLGQTATFTALGEGTALIVEVQVNNGLVRGRAEPAETTNTAKVYVPTSDGLEVGAVGETYESDPVYGTTALLNGPIRSLAQLKELISTTPTKLALASSTANLTLSGIPASGDADGITLSAGDPILLLGQSTGSENGLWTVAAGAWSRPDNWSAASAGELRGSIVVVVAGTLRGGFIYQLTNAGAFTVDSSVPSFSRLPDRNDRVVLGTVTSIPTADALVRYDGSGNLVANAFVAGTANPASTGLLRASATANAVAFRDSTGLGDLVAVSADGSDNLTLGGSAWQSVEIVTDTSRPFRFVQGAASVFQWYSTGLAFDRAAQAQITQDGVTSGAGAALRIVAQSSTAGAGGNVELYVGEGSTTPGEFRIDLGKSAGDVTGNFYLAGGALGDLLQAYYDGGQPGWFITASDEFDFSAGTFRVNAGGIGLVNNGGANGSVWVESDGVAFGATGSYGSGQRVVYVANAAVVPTTNPSLGGILYAEGGALKWRGSSGTVTTIAPA